MGRTWDAHGPHSAHGPPQSACTTKGGLILEDPYSVPLIGEKVGKYFGGESAEGKTRKCINTRRLPRGHANLTISLSHSFASPHCHIFAASNFRIFAFPPQRSKQGWKASSQMYWFPLKNHWFYMVFLTKPLVLQLFPYKTIGFVRFLWLSYSL